MNRITQHFRDVHIGARPELRGSDPRALRRPLNQANGRRCADSHAARHHGTRGGRRSWLVRWLRIQWKRFVRWMLEPVPFPKRGV
jgi:hypothetical protein